MKKLYRTRLKIILLFLPYLIANIVWCGALMGVFRATVEFLEDVVHTWEMGS